MGDVKLRRLVESEIIMATQCPNCKTLNRDTATFCDSCHARLIDTSEQVTPAVAVVKPTTVPENEVILTKPSEIPPSTHPYETVTPPKVNPPKVKPGMQPFRRARFWYCVFVLAAGVIGNIIILLVDPDAPVEAFVICFIIFGVIALVIGFPIFRWRTEYSSMGIVNHLRQWSAAVQITKQSSRKIPPNWVFDLRLTDDNYRILRDKKGFLLPIVEIEFRSDRLHGPPLEEGSKVVLKGRLKGGRVNVKNMWNISSSIDESVLDEHVISWGRVTNLQSKQAQDMRYPGQRSIEVLDFRLQRTDADFQELLRDLHGTLLPSLTVEIRAQSISGTPHEGDKVEIIGQLAHGTLYTREVYNHSAGGSKLVVKEWAGVP